ncbi:RNA polymerase sigma factor [Gemmata sp. G18]|uniref:RNA polymerase sigma factor n=1 Tax=Gemmata palustris TaxID=2822762 RepID=A0ABS5BUQ4_9BACT|nr:RNA polymerase sigma factor [Gemmata palustris]MBP3957449.1 RNA polymerase sigma factor [Gemmata palustris]
MNPTRIHTIANRFTAPRERADAPTDAELLGRFLDARDQTAFADLVTRHAPAVRAVCRSVLRDPNDADDAAQATFLVLVRRAGVVRDRAALGGWLSRVAWRAANRLRADNLRRDDRTAGVDPDFTPAAQVAGDSPDLAIVLDEIGKLPERYRVAVLACYATETPTAEAARQLGWPKGTLLTRLAWARKRLRDRLARRGVTLAGGLVVVLANRLGSAGAASFADRITRVAAALVADARVEDGLVSERVFPLTNGVVRAMIGTKLKAAIGIGLLLAVLLGLGLGRSTVATAEANTGDGKKLVAADKAEKADRGAPAKADEEQQPNVVAIGPGKELVVRRPFGSYTREVQPYGRATLTFTEDRLHVQATVSIEKFTVTVTADADYSVNRESLVYGVITGADATGAGEAAGAFAPFAVVATDLPFAFRVRVEDDAITIKDIKAGPFGSPLLMEALTNEKTGKEMLLVASMVGGKYKVDPSPDRNTAPPVARPRKK